MSLAAGVEALTFDCYGTIVDWDGGILRALGDLPSLAGCDLARLVVDREEAEKQALAGPFRLYRDVLAESLREAAHAQECAPTAAEVGAFVESMGRWRLFPDSFGALQRLHGRFRLAILSNVETRVLRRSLSSLEDHGIHFEALVTAEEVRSYKPARVHFDVAHERLELPRSAIRHVAGSLFHDVRPALEYGWHPIFVDRRGEGRPEDLPDLPVFEDLASLADALLGESG